MTDEGSRSPNSAVSSNSAISSSVLCVIQARTGSTRLPGKVLQDLGGRPILRFMLDRLAPLSARVVVATSSLERDDPVAEIARVAGRSVVRGSESDVLSRFVDALDAHPADHVVRLTADCPLTDPVLVEAVIARHLEWAADYTSNVFPRTYPKGLDVEVVRADALRAAHLETRDPVEREHVTPFFYRRPERFRLANLRATGPGPWLGREGWTVDTADDLAFVREIVARMGRDAFGWEDAWRVVGTRAAPRPDEIVLAPAGAEQRDFVLACRRDPDAVSHSRSGRAIEAAEHDRWFAEVLDDPGVRLRIASLAGETIGTVRVDVRGGEGEVGVALAPKHRRRGLGTALLEALVADTAADPQVSVLLASVHPDNVASRRIFRRAGFVAAGEDGIFLRLRYELSSEAPATPAGTLRAPENLSI